MPKKHAKLKARSKVWLELDGEPVFGDGKLRWLELIDSTGSISSAAEQLHMSYRSLWGRLSEMERRLGMKLLKRRSGGPSGGGTTLTDEGRELVKQYRSFRKGLNSLVNKRFEAVFKK